VREVLAEPAAGIMAASANVAGLEVLLRAHVTYHTMMLEEGDVFTKDRTTYWPVLGVSPIGQGPGDMATFADMRDRQQSYSHALGGLLFLLSGGLRYNVHSQCFY
jgi:hypothetical protein